ncbi:hypothetical protein [Acidovorax sp. FJL06]|uniref:hypothetical protein n=1 Tax=Acidovorax sp. FJL06 TaxID=2153365 RepID=UPI000F5831ED|nr:hypothetical protein [Acidovorax sp. FJL06]
MSVADAAMPEMHGRPGYKSAGLLLWCGCAKVQQGVVSDGRKNRCKRLARKESLLSFLMFMPGRGFALRTGALGGDQV